MFALYVKDGRKIRVNIWKIEQKQKLNGVGKFVKTNSCVIKNKMSIQML